MDPTFAPNFAVDGGIGVALARGLADAGLLSTFGAVLFRAVLAPPILARLDPVGVARFGRRFRRLVAVSVTVALLGGLAWLVQAAFDLSTAPGWRAALTTLPVVVTDTMFGHALAARSGLLLLTGVAVACGWRWLAVATALLATVSQAGHSHAAAMGGLANPLLLSTASHLLAAGAWLGGLVPLLLLVDAVPPVEAARAARRFAWLGTICVIVIATTATVQGLTLIGGLPGLLGTGYGMVAVLKLGLFTGLIALACRNRFRHTPALMWAGAWEAKARLRRSIARETGVGLAVVLAAGLLTSMAPAMHLEPVWPFAWRPSLDAVHEDPDIAAEVGWATLAMAVAIGYVVVSVARRRLRALTLLVGVAIAALAAPHFGPLFVPAYPTSFFTSPTGFAVASIAQGAALYPTHCAACHGAQGRGDGPAAKGLRIPPADLTAPHLWYHEDGELFWWLSHGMDDPEGGLAMPGFADVLSDDDRWALIDFIRARNAGLTHAATGDWTPPVQAPEFEVTCGGETKALHELRPRFVRLVFGPTPADDVADVVTIATQPGGAGCTTEDAAVVSVYAIVTGIPAAQLAGVSIIIDPDGWLRAVQRPNDPSTWTDAKWLSAEVATLRAHPVVAPTHAPMDMNMPM